MTLSLAVLGYGFIGDLHTHAASVAGAEVAVVSGHRADAAREFATRHGIASSETDWVAAVTRDDVDAVVIGTPNSLHHPQAMAAIEAGKHVLIEKPMATTPEEARAIRDAAHAAGVTVLVGHMWRYRDEVLALRDRIASGDLGRVVRTRGFGIHARWGPTGWFTDPALSGGGALADMGIHAIDTARFLLGDPEPLRVVGSVGTAYGDYGPDLGPVTIDDDGIVLIDWDDGVRSVIESGWWQPVLDGVEAETDVYATGGHARIWPQFTSTAPPPDDYVHCSLDMFSAQMRDFVECCTTGRTPVASAQVGVTAVEIVAAAYAERGAGSAEATGVKISVVGGGSTYTPELIDGLLRRQEMLGVDEISLIDPDADRLAVIGPLAQRMAARAAPGVTITWGDRLDAGVRHATFVVSQIRVGGMAARERDEQLGREFGLIGQETVGVGGFANALRTIPVALDIAEVVKREAPDATLFNFTNPAGLVTEALCRHSTVPTIGLCNVPWSVTAHIAAAFDTSADAIDLDYVGLNHLSWIRRITIDGRDRTAEVLDGLAAISGRRRGTDAEPDWSADSIRLIGALPNPYLLYYYETAAWTAYQSSHPTRASEVMDIERALLRTFADPGLDQKPAELELRGGAYYSEAAAALMADLHADAGTVHVVNTPNRGAIPGLDDDVVVETAARINGTGPVPVPTGPLREDVDAMIRTMKDFELLTVDAAVHGDHDSARRALLTNPLGPPAHLIDAVWDRLREVHAGWLGRLDERARA